MKTFKKYPSSIKASTDGSNFGPSTARELQRELNKYDPHASELVNDCLMIALSNGDTAVVFEDVYNGGWTYVVVDPNKAKQMSGNDVVNEVLQDWGIA